MSVGAALCGAASTIAGSDLRTVQLWLYRVMTVAGPDGLLRQRLRRP